MSIFRAIFISAFVFSAFFPTAKASAGLFKRKSSAIYGIEKKVYETFTEDQKKQLMEAHHGFEQYKEEQKTKEEQLQKQIKDLEKELQKISVLEAEKQRIYSHAEKVQADLNSRTKELDFIIEMAQNLINASTRGKNYVPSEKREKYVPRINSLNRGFNSTTLTLDNDTTIEISPFEKDKTELWMRGQAIELSKGEGLIYSIQITNLDVGNTVAAKIKS